MHDRTVQFPMAIRASAVAPGALETSGMRVAVASDAVGLRGAARVAAGAPGGDELRLVLRVAAHTPRVREGSGWRFVRGVGR